MAKEYKPPRTINRLSKWFARRGIGRAAVLTTVGRASGEFREVPVSPMSVDGVEYVVAPYGAVGWVANVRAHPEAAVTVGRSSRRVRLVEVTPDAAQVVKLYYEREPFPRPYMDVPKNPTIEDFEKASGSFPVFRIDPA